jgi:hypothetical protein
MYRYLLKPAVAMSLLLSLPALGENVPMRPVVVELYTSQGCSSCPPAEALLGELAGKPNIIALAFHVDYWDSIGWRDGFSIPQAAQRQRGYVETLNLSSAFTPQVIVDGRESFVGSDRRRILGALAPAANANSIAVPVALEIVRSELTVSLSATNHRGDYDVNLVAYLPHASTAVGRGENSGRTLAEFNIVRQFRRLGSWQGQKSTFQVPLDSFPPDATRVAVLVQRAGQGDIEGAAVAALR